jgi:hypothetical protein
MLPNSNYHDDQSPEAQLWKAKCFRMLCDALGFVGAGMKAKDKQKCVSEARLWFYDKKYKSEFEATCEAASYEPEQVRAAARKLITAKQSGDHSNVPDYWRKAFRDGRMPSLTAYNAALAKSEEDE